MPDELEVMRRVIRRWERAVHRDARALWRENPSDSAAGAMDAVAAELRMDLKNAGVPLSKPPRRRGR